MLKQTVTYEDYNGETQTEDLYFNLTRTELAEILDIQPRLEAWLKKVSGPSRDLTTDEVKEMLAIVKFLINRSYGVRSEDGKHFRKNEEIFRDFEESAAYDAFVFGLFSNADLATNFMTGVLPQQLLAQAAAQAEASNELKAVETEVPAYIREDREPTTAELREMTPEELRQAFMLRTNK